MLSLWVIRQNLQIDKIQMPTKLWILGGRKIVLRFLLMEFIEV